MPEPGPPSAPATSPAKPPERERFWEIVGATDDPAERPHGEWRRRLHRFCENWIFALVIAFAIRHFGVELFRIPSASMEPVLLGDPGLGKGDFVLVDKLTSRFREPQRWDVAVFQYPVPEIESSKGGRARPAESHLGERLDHPLWRPLVGGNFVKRIVVMPGEEFYIQAGDVFIRTDGTWSIARKPPALQERLWQTIYRADGQPGYRPWSAEAGAAVEVLGGRLEAKPAGGRLVFSQPLRNVYLKDGAVAVRPLGSNEGWTKIEGVSMTAPRFAWTGGREGSIWDLGAWELKRLTSADEDDPMRKGTPLNQLMNEWNSDLRIGGRVERLDGEVVLELRAQSGGADPERLVSLAITADGWRLSGAGRAAGLAAEGRARLVGASIDLAQIDGQVVVRIDGADVHRSDLAWVDGNRHWPGIAIAGTGTASFAAFTVQRDLHYSAKGFMVQAPQAADPASMAEQIASGQGDAEDKDNAYAAAVRLPRLIRGELLGKPSDELSRSEATAAYGTGPNNPARAPEGGYLMLGDNSPLSLDGREWGFVPAENLRGSGWLIVFPPWRWGLIR